MRFSFSICIIAHGGLWAPRFFALCQDGRFVARINKRDVAKNADGKRLNRIFPIEIVISNPFHNIIQNIKRHVRIFYETYFILLCIYFFVIIS